MHGGAFRSWYRNREQPAEELEVAPFLKQLKKSKLIFILIWTIAFGSFFSYIGNFIIYDFWTPWVPLSPLLSILYIDIKWKRILKVRHVAAALGPLACPSLSARPRKCLNLTYLICHAFLIRQDFQEYRCKLNCHI